MYACMSIVSARRLTIHACMNTVDDMRITPKPNAIYGVSTELGISRDELARRMRVSTATAFRVDMGTVDPSPKFIAGLIDVSGRKFEELFDIVSEDAA